MVESTTGVVGKLAGMANKRLPNDCNLKKGAESFEDLSTQGEERAEETQELIHQEEKIGNRIEEMMDSISPNIKSSSQETVHGDDELVKRFSQVITPVATV